MEIDAAMSEVREALDFRAIRIAKLFRPVEPSAHLLGAVCKALVECFVDCKPTQPSAAAHQEATERAPPFNVCSAAKGSEQQFEDPAFACADEVVANQGRAARCRPIPLEHRACDELASRLVAGEFRNRFDVDVERV